MMTLQVRMPARARVAQIKFERDLGEGYRDRREFAFAATVLQLVDVHAAWHAEL